ncbi:hypothetical protein ABPG74_012115 [Tetrahymena malaccensis]
MSLQLRPNQFYLVQHWTIFMQEKNKNFRVYIFPGSFSVIYLSISHIKRDLFNSLSYLINIIFINYLKIFINLKIQILILLKFLSSYFKIFQLFLKKSKFNTFIFLRTIQDMGQKISIHINFSIFLTIFQNRTKIFKHFFKKYQVSYQKRIIKMYQKMIQSRLTIKYLEQIALMSKEIIMKQISPQKFMQIFYYLQQIPLLLGICQQQSDLQ